MIAQVPAGATDAQLLVCEKLVELPSLIATLVIVSVPLPGFETVIAVGDELVPTVCAANVTLVGLKLICGVAVTPVQVIETAWGEAAALSVMLIDAENAAAESGAQVVTRVQLPPGRIKLPQLFDCEKSAVLAPVNPILEMVRVPVPVFVSVTFLGGLTLPTKTLPKARLAGLRETVGVPAPLANGCG